MQDRLYLFLLLIELERRRYRYRILLLLEKFEKYEIEIFCLLVQQQFEASSMPYNALNQFNVCRLYTLSQGFVRLFPALFLKKVILFHNFVPNIKLGRE